MMPSKRIKHLPLQFLRLIGNIGGWGVGEEKEKRKKIQKVLGIYYPQGGSSLNRMIPSIYRPFSTARRETRLT